MNLLDGVSAIVIAGYLGTVIFNGNLLSLIAELKTELGYLELVIGYFLLQELMKFPATSGISKAFVYLGLTAGALKLITAIPPQLFTDFAAGKIGLTNFVISAANNIGQQFNPLRNIPGQTI